MTNCLDPDQARHFVGSDLGSNCLQRLSADDISYHAALVRCFAGYHTPASILKTEGKSFLSRFFFNLTFSKNSFRNTIRVPNGLDPCKFGSRFIQASLCKTQRLFKDFSRLSYSFQGLKVYEKS